MHCSNLITLFHLLIFFLFIYHISSADPLAIETLEGEKYVVLLKYHESKFYCYMLGILFFFFCFFFLVIDNGGDDDDVCGKVDCGQGKCVPSNTSFLGVKGFDCFCKPGWQKTQLGPIILPACTIPNCEYPFFFFFSFSSARFFKEDIYIYI